MPFNCQSVQDNESLCAFKNDWGQPVDVYGGGFLSLCIATTTPSGENAMHAQCVRLNDSIVS